MLSRVWGELWILLGKRSVNDLHTLIHPDGPRMPASTCLAANDYIYCASCKSSVNHCAEIHRSDSRLEYSCLYMIILVRRLTCITPRSVKVPECFTSLNYIKVRGRY